ncbi:RASGRP3 isoform 10, partial [Pan troglodytes]
MGSSGLGKAATLDELLRTCIEMFDDNGELDNSYL